MYQIDLLNNFPNEAAFLFIKRSSEFMCLYLKKTLNIIDFWYRVEFQQSGPYIHGLFWSELPDGS